MSAIPCPTCGQESLRWNGRCRHGCKPLSFGERQRQRSRELADRIAKGTSDPGYAAWQRLVITDVVHGGGIAGYVLVLSTVAVCTAVLLGVHRGSMQWFKLEHSPGVLFYMATVLPVTVVYFRLAAPLFYRLHVWLTERRAV